MISEEKPARQGVKAGNQDLLTVGFSPELLARINAKAADLGVSRSAVIKQACSLFVADKMPEKAVTLEFATDFAPKTGTGVPRGKKFIVSLGLKPDLLAAIDKKAGELALPRSTLINQACSLFT